MPKSSLIRRLKVKTKLLLDNRRPYSKILRYSPCPVWTARQLGSLIHKSAIVKEKLQIDEPAWFQMNAFSYARNVFVNGLHLCYIGERCTVDNLSIQDHTFIFNNQVFIGTELKPYRITVSVDLEGKFGISPNSSNSFGEIQEKASKVAAKILNIFRKYNIKSTWYVVGKLFSDDHFESFCDQLLEDIDVEIGWHTNNHINYFLSSPEEVNADLDYADGIRQKYTIPLNKIAFPFNSIGHVGKVISSGFDDLRGYVGQYYIPVTLDLGDFIYRGTSLYLGPNTIKNAICSIPHNPTNFNIFLHPVDWIDQDLEAFVILFDKLSDRL